VDNGHRNLTELQAEFNKDDITRKVMAKYIKWEYENRQLLQQRGHSSGGVYITVFNRQDADLLIRKGIRAYDLIVGLIPHLLSVIPAGYVD
jgi:hypothetical protein